MKYLEFNGGLGDIVYSMYDNNKYLSLESLEPGERVTISIIGNNPAIKELFTWHPKFSQMDIREIEHQHPWGPDQRRQHGLPEAESELSGVGGKRVTYYPPKEDLELIESFQYPYIVFSLTAGLPYRNVPIEAARSAALVARRMGFTPILVGRNFVARVGYARPEIRLEPGYGAIDLIDRLSFPGTARLIEKSAGVFCHEGAVMHLTWRMHHPCFVVPSHLQTQWAPGQWACWGVDQPKTGWAFGRDFTEEKFESWIKDKVLAG